MKPPGVKTSWDECSTEIQLMLIAYDDIRQHEENQHTEAMLKVLGAVRGGM